MRVREEVGDIQFKWRCFCLELYCWFHIGIVTSNIMYSIISSSLILKTYHLGLEDDQVHGHKELVVVGVPASNYQESRSQDSKEIDFLLSLVESQDIDEREREV